MRAELTVSFCEVFVLLLDQKGRQKTVFVHLLVSYCVLYVCSMYSMFSGVYTASTQH